MLYIVFCYQTYICNALGRSLEEAANFVSLALSDPENDNEKIQKEIAFAVAQLAEKNTPQAQALITKLITEQNFPYVFFIHFIDHPKTSQHLIIERGLSLFDNKQADEISQFGWQLGKIKYSQISSKRKTLITEFGENRYNELNKRVSNVVATLKNSSSPDRERIITVINELDMDEFDLINNINVPPPTAHEVLDWGGEGALYVTEYSNKDCAESAEDKGASSTVEPPPKRYKTNKAVNGFFLFHHCAPNAKNPNAQLQTSVHFRYPQPPRQAENTMSYVHDKLKECQTILDRIKEREQQYAQQQEQQGPRRS